MPTKDSVLKDLKLKKIGAFYRLEVLSVEQLSGFGEFGKLNAELLFNTLFQSVKELFGRIFSVCFRKDYVRSSPSAATGLPGRGMTNGLATLHHKVNMDVNHRQVVSAVYKEQNVGLVFYGVQSTPPRCMSAKGLYSLEGPSFNLN